ncbi:GNAT family N-acetyltransferase [Acinetobacter sp. R933-2]|uniref:GNAT family N-acetyltransferase n=1 Tax=Acinetobacter sp. R933-2 TaxID=2746728 RepID=UPI0025756F34|nr:GNAT family N-acetyltransferase [Acinetobacter sp. R933-2]MDM1246971.1 GNAT family N-acetyltransferase [Acinetobacter sp. R933-2]
MSKIMIRQLNADDVGDFRTIRLSALKNSPEMFGSSYTVEATKPLSVFAEVITNYVIFSAYTQQKIIGVLILDLENDSKNKPQAQLYGFFVEPAFRGQGIATQLLQAGIQYGQPYVEKITLSVMTSNIPAIRLYQKLGFKINVSSEMNDENEVKMIFFY